MRKPMVLLAAALALAFGTRAALAFGGTGNISPEESPYAVLEPQTLGPASLPPASTGAPAADEPPIGAMHERARHKPEPKAQ